MKSFIFPKHFYEAAQKLEKDKMLNFYNAIFQYVFEDAEPIIDDPIVKAMFELAKPQVIVVEEREENE